MLVFVDGLPGATGWKFNSFETCKVLCLWNCLSVFWGLSLSISGSLVFELMDKMQVIVTLEKIEKVLKQSLQFKTKWNYSKILNMTNKERICMATCSWLRRFQGSVSFVSGLVFIFYFCFVCILCIMVEGCVLDLTLRNDSCVYYFY